MIQTAPISLEAAGSEWLLDDTPGSEYRVSITPGTHVAVCFGEDARKRMGHFAHANLAARQKRLHEFKHYRPNGSKFWTARPGVDLWFIFPKEEITLLPEKGCSYVPAMIGGVRVSLNVSGGSCDKGGWSDRVGAIVHAGVGHPLRSMLKLAAVAVRGTSLERSLASEFAETKMDARQARQFANLVAASRMSATLVQRFMDGARDLKIQIADGYEGSGEAGIVEEIRFARSTVWRKPTAAESAERPEVQRLGMRRDTKRARSYLVRFKSGQLFRVTPKQVDWARTEVLNFAE